MRIMIKGGVWKNTEVSGCCGQRASEKRTVPAWVSQDIQRNDDDCIQGSHDATVAKRRSDRQDFRRPQSGDAAVFDL